MVWGKMTTTEVQLAKAWFVNDGEKPSEIARRLGRDKSTITRLLIKRRPRNAQGRKRLLTAAAVDKLEKKLEEMILKADGRHNVTVAMLKRSSRQISEHEQIAMIRLGRSEIVDESLPEGADLATA